MPHSAQTWILNPRLSAIRARDMKSNLTNKPPLLNFYFDLNNFLTFEFFDQNICSTFLFLPTNLFGLPKPNFHIFTFLPLKKSLRTKNKLDWKIIEIWNNPKIFLDQDLFMDPNIFSIRNSFELLKPKMFPILKSQVVNL